MSLKDEPGETRSWELFVICIKQMQKSERRASQGKMIGVAKEQWI